jgi:hypothetical protein
LLLPVLEFGVLVLVGVQEAVVGSLLPLVAVAVLVSLSSLSYVASWPAVVAVVAVVVVVLSSPVASWPAVAVVVVVPVAVVVVFVLLLLLVSLAGAIVVGVVAVAAAIVVAVAIVAAAAAVVDADLVVAGARVVEAPPRLLRPHRHRLIFVFCFRSAIALAIGSPSSHWQFCHSPGSVAPIQTAHLRLWHDPRWLT